MPATSTPLVDRNTITTPLLYQAGELSRDLQVLAARLTVLAGAEGFTRQAGRHELDAVRAAAAAVRSASVDLQLVATELHGRALAAGDCGHGYRVSDSCPMCDAEAENLNPEWLTSPAGPPAYQVPVDADEVFEAFVDPVGATRPGARYWIARHGLVVTSQIEGREIDRTEHHGIEQARAGFAGETCDPGPGGPQPGDTLTVHWGPAVGRTLVIEHVHRLGDDFEVTAVGETQPVALSLGQYRITHRTSAGTVQIRLAPTATPPAAATPASPAGPGGCPRCGARGEWQPDPALALICGVCGHRS